MRVNLKTILVFALLLAAFSLPAEAGELAAKEGQYLGWGIITKTDPGFASVTYHWKTYPDYPDNENHVFYPGDLIAQQKINCCDSGAIIYSSLCAGKVHLLVRFNGYRTAHQITESVLDPGQETIIGPVFDSGDAAIIIKLLSIGANGEASFIISQITKQQLRR